jgi:hypothetical protein
MWPLMLDALRPFVGKKIVLASGVLSDRVRNALPELPMGGELNGGYYEAGPYSVRAVVRVCMLYQHRFAGQIAEYAEVMLPLGAAEDGVLTYIQPSYPLRADYTVEEVLAAREELKTAKTAVNTAQTKLAHFGEYDQ